MGFDIGELVERAQVGEHTVTVPGLGRRGPGFSDIRALQGGPEQHVCGANGYRDAIDASCSRCDYNRDALRALDRVYQHFFPDQEKRAPQ